MRPGMRSPTRGVLVEIAPLHERRRAVADADDGDVDLAVLAIGTRACGRDGGCGLAGSLARGLGGHSGSSSLLGEQFVLRQLHDVADGVDELAAGLLRTGLDLREVALADAVAAAGEFGQQPALLLPPLLQNVEYANLHETPWLSFVYGTPTFAARSSHENFTYAHSSAPHKRMAMVRVDYLGLINE